MFHSDEESVVVLEVLAGSQNVAAECATYPTSAAAATEAARIRERFSIQRNGEGDFRPDDTIFSTFSNSWYNPRMSTPKQLAAAEHVAAVESSKPLPLKGISFREFLLAHRRYPVIAVTGQSGVGKTTFTNLLISHIEEAL